ncbi:MAG TPA: valine--tRNA ligase [Thermoplasmata archaeon]|nr:valine--tRNA ligase [Thermoplasmata archaeon]
MSPTELPSRFDPATIERRWQTLWAEQRLFQAPERPHGRKFAIPLPPPNVTGFLTIGHMLGGTVQDLLVRLHRMRGDAVLWLPGVDHAGVATQVEVRKQLAREGVRMEELPRARVIEQVEEWKRSHEARILEQERAAGFSLDMTRYRYTMDPGFQRATRRAFVRLYREGLLYRGERIVNWDPVLRTALSDLEVLHRDEPAELLYVRYPFADGSPGGITVATVRPETIFGDVGVAVHPDDERHRAIVGRTVRVPLTDRVVPILTDDLIDPTFGNGALKLTPAHDVLDFQIAKRHPELAAAPDVFDASAHLAGEAVPERFRGLDRDRARSEVTEALRAAGQLERTEKYVHSVGRSERSDAVIEPRLSTQWFVRMPALAPPVVEAVRKGEVKIHPARWELTFYRWMEALEDWCISRQVVWGHPVPVVYCESCGAEIVEEEPVARCPKCAGERLRNDPDVLDTWFSSWMWPFATLGWPEETSDLAAYFPTDVLVTGRDIMFFWVARMLMASYHFTGRRPFSDVYFTGMLRDEQGRRMSKHLGNSPDPVDVIGRWGADAMRFALLFPNPADQDGPFKENSLEGARNFLTKLWNLVRLLASHLPAGTPAVTQPPHADPEAPLADRWLLSRWRHVAEEYDRALEEFEFTRAAGALRDFLWHDVADRYVEVRKEALAGREGESAARRTREVLLFVMDRSLRHLHPVVPHVTEELWQALPHSGETLETARWPSATDVPLDPESEVAMETVLESIRLLRLLRSENNLPVSEMPAAWVRPSGPDVARLLTAEGATVRRLARVGELTLLGGNDRTPEKTYSVVAQLGEIFLARSPEAEQADWEALLREKEKLAGLLRRAEARLADPGFRDRAPPAVVEETRAKASELGERLRRIDEHLRATQGAAEAS